MFNSHLFKVIASFCGVILFGLITLVVIDSFKSNEASVAPLIKKTNPVAVPTKASKTTPKPASKSIHP